MTIEITAGLVMTAVGVLGTILCLAVLAATGPVFRKKRKKLLDEIESE